jgi:hypothetical protein
MVHIALAFLLLVDPGMAEARSDAAFACSIPGNPRNGFLLFAAKPDVFHQLAPKFDALARETRGAASPLAHHRTLLSTLAGSIGLLLIGLWLLSRRRARGTPPRCGRILAELSPRRLVLRAGSNHR